MFGGYFLNIHDTSGSETDVNFQRMCQKFILQKERQVFIKCILRNVHNSYVFVHIGRRYCGRETVTPSTRVILLYKVRCEDKLKTKYMAKIGPKL